MQITRKGSGENFPADYYNTRVILRYIIYVVMTHRLFYIIIKKLMLQMYKFQTTIIMIFGEPALNKI